MLPPEILDRVLTPTASLRVVRVMFLEPNTAFTGRGLARRAGVSPPQTEEALKRLESIGLVRRRAVGRADSWTLVTDHALGPILLGLFDSERGLATNLRSELQHELERLGAKNAVIFGSVARGDHAFASDIDLFVEVPTKREATCLREALVDVRIRLWRKYATMVSPLILTSAEVRRHSNPFLLENIREEAVPVAEGTK